MLPSLLYMALARFAGAKLADMNPAEVARVLRLLRRAAARTSWAPTLLGLGAGLAAGAALGALFAPRSGAELRAALADRVRDRLGMVRGTVRSEAPPPETATTPASANGGSPAQA